jgi:putative inorganic carbon (HCO3(-)) transporter
LITARRPAYGLALLVLAVPFALSREIAATTVSLPKSVLLGVIAGLLSFSGAARALREAPVRPIAIALAAYVAIVALSALDALHRGPVARETLKWIEYAAIACTAYLCRRLDPSDAPIAAAFAIATALVSFGALAQEIVGAPSGLFVGKAIVPRIAGSLEGPNQLAGYYESAIAALIAWTIARRNGWYAAALALAVAVDVLTFSRAGLIGLAIVFAVVAFAAGRKALVALRPIVAGCIGGLAVVGWWMWYAHSADVLRLGLEESRYAGGVGDRGELWRAAWNMWRSRPLLGVGAGNYELELPAYGTYGVRTHANSWYLQSLAEGGIALFAATLALIAACMTTLLRGLRRVSSPWLLAALAATCALAAHQVVDDLVFYPKVASEWWLLVGLAAATLPAPPDR